MNQIDTSQLVELQNGEVTTTSLQVAERFGKRHKDILRTIDNLIGGLRNIAPTPEIRGWSVGNKVKKPYKSRTFES